jgi:flavin reductase (DIM6/NTAB) family NADH-FMN oxidoreductase RutF
MQVSASHNADVYCGYWSAMRRLDATVCVMTCADRDGWHGMPATALTSLCIDPPALIVCVNKAATFWPAFRFGKFLR